MTPTSAASWARRLLVAVLALAGALLLAACDPQPPSFRSDDFSAGYLGGRWEVVDPRGDGSVALTGLGTSDARVELSVPAGVDHQPWTTNDALRIVQQLADTDVELEAKFDSVPTAAFQEQGLLVEEDADSYLRFEVHHDGTTLRAFAARIVDGSASSVANVAIPTGGSSVWLRVARTGDQWRFDTSTDGSSWVTRASFTQPLVVTHAGVFAGNFGPGPLAPAWTAAVDYVFDTATPVVPEDPTGPRFGLDTTVVGQGTVERLPDLPSYAAGETVLLGAAPAPGWTFAGWSGDASGTVPLVTVVADHHLEVTATFVPDPGGPPVQALVSDDFRTGALGEHWTVHDPRGDGSVAVTGAGTADARLALSVPAGVNHEPWVPNTSLHAMQTIDDVDFGVEAKFDSIPAVAFQEEGVLVREDDGNYLRFDLHHDGTTLRALAARVDDGVPAVVSNVAVPGGSALWVRVERTGDTFSFQTSTDGTTWATRATVVLDLEVHEVGVFAGNFGPGTSAPAWTALVDYVFDTAAPLVPEDPVGPPVTLTTSVVGQGSIQRQPDQTQYAQGQQVVLTAVPAPGWAFTGWSGDVQSTANPLTVTPTGDTALTATFVEQPDDQPPVISGVAVSGITPTSAVVGWSTDELATSFVDHGPTTAYENGTAGTASFVLEHAVPLTGLAPNTTYHVRVRSSDPSGNEAVDVDRTFTTPPLSSGGPTIDVWYGNTQAFGTVGLAQRWVNVLGRATDPDGVVAMSYRLNGGPPVPMGIGPDNRRLVRTGDFNVDLATDQLLPGANTLQIDALDGSGHLGSTTVTVQFDPTRTWPLPYAPTFAPGTQLSDVVQVVDGRWEITGGQLRTADADIGYDRLVAVGDATWTDYEATFTMRVNALADPTGPFSGQPAAGFLLRWSGHNTARAGEQPLSGYRPNGTGEPTPFGAYGLWRNSPTGGGRLELRDHTATVQGVDPSFDLVLGQTYRVRARATTDPGTGETTYAFKVWAEGTAEPPGWNLELVAGTGAGEPASGSLVLLAHEADVDFGDLEVHPVAPTPQRLAALATATTAGAP